MATYYMPVKVFEETDVVRKKAGEIAKLGSKALIVTGKHSAKANGSLDDVIAALDEYNISYIHFNKIEENPLVETVMEAVDFAKNENVDFVVAIGGGSPLDAAKAIALMLKHTEEDSSYLFRAGGDDSHLPLCLIPTTCGTGSEVTGVSVLTRNDIKTKQSISFKIFGNIALLDGKYLESLSPKVLKNTAMDAFCHLVESYVNNNATIYSRIVCLDGLSSFKNVLPVVKGEKKPELSDYFNLLRTSTYAGMAIAQTGTAIPHGLSYAFTYNLGVEHGRACGYFLAGYLKIACKKWTCLSQELSDYFKTNLNNKFSTVGEAEVNFILNTAGIASVEEFEKLYALVCEKVEVEEAKLNKELDNTVNDLFNNKAKLSVAPFTITKEELTEIAYDISRKNKDCIK